MNPKTTLRLALWTGGVLCLFIVLLCALFLFLQTQTAKAILASKLAALLSSEPNQRVSIDKLDGLIPFQIHMNRISVSDPQGVWLTVNDVALKGVAVELLRRHLRIDEISAAALKLERLPASDTEREAEQGEPFWIPERFPNITIKKLTVQNFSLAEAVAGQAADFQIAGSLRQSPLEPEIMAFLRLDRKDAGPQTRADIKITRRSDPSAIEVSAEFFEAAGGLLAKALKLKDSGPISLALKGDGPKTDWKGTLQAEASALGSVQAQIGMQAEQNETLFVEGSYEPSGESVPPGFGALVGVRNDFAFTVHFAPSHTLSVENATIRGAGYCLQFSGALDYKSLEVESNGSVEVDDLKVLEGVAGLPLWGDLKGRLALKGTLPRPQGTLSLHLNGLHVKGVETESVETDLEFEPLEPAGTSSFAGFKVKGNGTAQGLKAMEGSPLSENTFLWSWEAEIPSRENIFIHSFLIESKSHQLMLTGWVDPSDLTANLDALLEVKDLKPLAAVVGKELSGAAAKVEAHVTADVRTGSASARMEGRLTSLDALSSRFAPILAPGFTFNGRFELLEKTRLSVPAFHLKSSFLTFDTQGFVDFSDTKQSWKWRLSVPGLELLKPVIEKPISGNLEAEGTLSGSYEALESTSTIKGHSIVLDQIEFKQLLSTLHIRDVTKAPQGEIRMEVRRTDQKLEASTDFALRAEQLTLSRIAIGAPGGKLSGSMAINLEKGIADGSLEGSFKEVKSLGQILGTRIGGSGKFQARFRPGKAGQNLKMTLQGTQLVAGFGTVKSIAVNADLENILQAPQGRAFVELAGFEGGKLIVESLKFKASGNEKAVSFDGSAKGRSIREFEIRTQGVLTHATATGGLRINTLDGRLGSYPLRLMQPLVLQRTAQGFSLDKVALVFGTGRLEMSGRSTARSISFIADLEDFRPEALAVFGGSNITGKVSGQIRLEGELSRPSGSFNLRLTPVSPPPDKAVKGNLEATLTAEGKLQNDTLVTGFELKGLSGKPTRGNFKVPVNFSLVPFKFSVPPQGPLQGHLEAESDLATLSLLFPLEGHRLTGQVSAAIDLEGTVAAPVVRGGGSITNGSYENFTNGTVLKNLAANITARGRRLEVESLRATDGGKGTVSASGWVELDKERHFPFELEGRVSKAALVRRDDLNASLSGELKLSGSVEEAALSGELRVESSEIVLLKSQPPPLAELEIVEIHAPEGKNVPAKEKEPEGGSNGTPPLNVKMDLDVKFPERSSVRGRGLNSEWAGELKIKGSADKPTVTGELKVVRGEYDFLGKRFKLVEGIVRFEGETPPVPTLNIAAEAKTPNLTARLLISGTALAPKITLESDPSLPSDEILSRLLFNRSPTQLSPLQGLQMANAARALSGRGDALDFMERMRESLGLEQLQLRESPDDKGGIAVGIGKYLTEGVYLDIEKGVGDESGKISAQVEITPNLRLESEAGIDAKQGIELNWKYDY